MRVLSTTMAAVVLGAWLMLPSLATAQPERTNATAIQRSLADLQRLRADLARANAEVAELKRSDRSVRADYRLRDRMADAEALAKKVTETESKLRVLGWVSADASTIRPHAPPPQVSSQDGSVELEAKAGLFADQAQKLDREADRLAKAAEELRSRRLLRRRAGAWDRDPFSGLESSKRSLATSATSSRSSLPPSASGNGSPTKGAGGPTLTLTGDSSGTTSSSSGTTIAIPAAGPSSEATASAKASPQASGGGLDRQTIDQRLYLDPTTAAELRQVLGGSGAASDPDALDRAASALRARARALQVQAQTLLQKSRVP
jgi:hypothetical protein